MAARDFTANQIRTAKVIMTGSDPKAGAGIGHNNLELSVYSESVAPDLLGSTPSPSPYSKVGNDTTIFISGSQTSRGGSTGGVTLFHGDTFISGTLVVENAGRSGTTGGSISGSIHRTAADVSYLVAGAGVTITSGSAGGGQITISGAAAQNLFQNVALEAGGGSIAGGNPITADASTDTLTLIAGSNITLTGDQSNDKITIAGTCCDDPVVAKLRDTIILSTNANGDLEDSNIDSSPNKSFEIDVTIGATKLDYVQPSSTTDSAYPSSNSKFKIHFAGIEIQGADISGTVAKANSAFTKAIDSDYDVFTVTHTAGTHKILEFDVTEASDVVKFTLQNVAGGTNQNIDSAYADATNRWDAFKIVVPLLIKDSNGNTQTIKVGTSVKKSRKGATGGRQPKALIKPQLHALSVDAAGNVTASEYTGGTTGPNSFEFAVYGDTTYQLPALGTSIADTSPAASKYHVDLGGSKVVISSLTSANSLSVTGGAKAVWDGNQTLKIVDNAGTPNDIVSFHAKVTSNNLELVLKTVHSNTFVHTDGQDAEPWKVIAVEPVIKATDAAGTTYTVSAGPFMIGKPLASGKDSVDLTFSPDMIEISTDASASEFDLNELHATPTNNDFVEASIVGADLVNPQADGNPPESGLTPTANNRYNLNFTSFSARVFPLDATKPPAACIASYDSGSDTLNIKTNSDVFLALKLVKDGTTNQARFYIDDATTVNFENPNDSNNENIWRYVDIVAHAKVKTNTGAEVNASGRFRVVKRINVSGIHQLDSGFDISSLVTGTVKVRTGDLILRTDDLKLFKVVTNMVNTNSALTTALDGATAQAKIGAVSGLTILTIPTTGGNVILKDDHQTYSNHPFPVLTEAVDENGIVTITNSGDPSSSAITLAAGKYTAGFTILVGTQGENDVSKGAKYTVTLQKQPNAGAYADVSGVRVQTEILGNVSGLSLVTGEAYIGDVLANDSFRLVVSRSTDVGGDTSQIIFLPQNTNPMLVFKKLT